MSVEEKLECISQICSVERFRTESIPSLLAAAGVVDRSSDDLTFHLSSPIAAKAEESRLRKRIANHATNLATHQLLWRVANGEVPQSDERLELTVNGKPYSCVVPGLCRDGYGSLYEIFVDNVYACNASDVDVIYDLGAFIGTTAIYFNAHHPNSRLVCVEPSDLHLHYLRQNLKANPSISYTILPYAIGGGSGTVSYHHHSTAPSMGNSTLASDDSTRISQVQSVTLADLTPRGRYGIKIDIEGAEFSLCSDASFLQGAAWITGELHYGCFSLPEHKWLRELLRESFDLVLGQPRLSFGQGHIIAGQNFTAIRRSKLMP